MEKSRTKKRKPVRMNSRVLTQSQMYTLLLPYMTPARAKVGSAIGMAESSGRVNAISATGDYGWPQINHAAHPQYSTAKLLSNPQYAAKAMSDISNHGKDWGPWTTFQSGAYRRFMGKSLKKATVPSGAGGPAAKVNTPSVSGLPATQMQAFNGLPTNQLAMFGLPSIPGLPDPTNIDPIPGGPKINPLDPLSGKGLGGGIADAVLPQQILDFFSLMNNLFTLDFWLKVGKVLLGVAAIWVGVNTLMKISVGATPGDVAKKGVKAAGTAAATAATFIPK